MKNNEDGAQVYIDPMNIRIGRGRILWGTATETNRERFHAGWVLPGGFRTRDEDEARAWAKWINEVSK